MKLHYIICLSFFILSNLKAQQIITVTDGSGVFSVEKDMATLPNAENHWTIQDVLQRDSLFKNLNKQSFPIGGFSPHVVWLKAIVNHNTTEGVLMDFNWPMLDSITIYQAIADGNIIKTEAGNKKRSPYAIEGNYQALQLSGKPQTTSTYYIQLTSKLPFGVKCRMGLKKAFIRTFRDEDLLNGLIAGCMLVFILFNLILRPVQKYVFHDHFAFLYFSNLFYWAYYNGYINNWFPSNIAFMNNFYMSLTLVPALSNLFLINAFFDLKNKSPKAHKLMVVSIFFNTFNLIFAFCGYAHYASELIPFLVMTSLVAMIMGASTSIKEGDKAAKFFLFGGFMSLIGVSLFVLDSYGYLSLPFPSRFFLEFFILLHGILTINAIATRLCMAREEKERIQIGLIQQLEENQIIIKNHSQELEQKVQERTTELMTKEGELVNIASKLEKSNKELTEFAYIVSHDLKAPFRNITSFIQLLTRSAKDRLNANEHEYVGFILTASKQASRLIDDLLNYSKVDKNIGDATDIDLNNVATMAVNNLQQFIQEHNATVTIEPLPTVMGHTSLLQQLLQNLIGNGLKYNENPLQTVTVGYDTSNKTYWVKDNGIGIPPQYEAEIFRMFRRLHSNDKYEGTGIGLAFCKRIVDTYKGTIWLQSEVGVGTTFYFTLPNAVVVNNVEAEIERVESIA